MKKLIVLIFISLILGLMQVSFFPEIFGSKVVINWILAFSFGWLLVEAPVTALKSAFIGGLILDIALGSRMGLSSLLLTSGVYVAILVRKYLFKGVIPHLVVTFIASYIYAILVYNMPASFITSGMVLAATTSFISYLFSLIYRQIISSGK